MSDDGLQELRKQVKILSETLWEGRGKQPDIDRWLGNFVGAAGPADMERLHALHLLSSVSYFGLRELRELLRAMFRDLYRYPIIQDLRAANADTRDASLIAREFQVALSSTRFLGMGNPAESGTHLLYYYRQENQLAKGQFANPHQLFSGPASHKKTVLAEAGIKRLVFIDDVCGSGQQSVQYSRNLLHDLRKAARKMGIDLRISYHVLFAVQSGLEYARANSDFDEVHAVHVLDDSYKTFAVGSRVYSNSPGGISRSFGETLALHYGSNLQPHNPLGYSDGQLLLAFHHNIPDNTLPIFWYDEGDVDWQPMFPRYPKVY